MRGPGWPSFEDFAAYTISLLLLALSFYGLLFAGNDRVTENDHLLFAGLITSVATWAFQRNAAKQTAKQHIEAQNGPISSMKSEVDALRRSVENLRPS